MAAHVLTIINQVLEKDDLNICAYALRSLNAPGWDSFPWGQSTLFWSAIEETAKLQDVRSLRPILEQAKILCEPSNSRFRCLGDFQEGLRNFVKFGKPYWRKRLDLFWKGEF